SDELPALPLDATEPEARLIANRAIDRRIIDERAIELRRPFESARRHLEELGLKEPLLGCRALRVERIRGLFGLLRACGRDGQPEENERRSDSSTCSECHRSHLRVALRGSPSCITCRRVPTFKRRAHRRGAGKEKRNSPQRTQGKRRETHRRGRRGRRGRREREESRGGDDQPRSCSCSCSCL